MKKNIVKIIIFAVVYSLAFAHIEILLRFVCGEPLQALMWWLSVVFLINGLISFLLSSKKNLSNKLHKHFLICEILFTAIGLILFVADAFLFISKIYISILLIISVVLIFTTLVLLQYWFVKQKEE